MLGLTGQNGERIYIREDKIATMSRDGESTILRLSFYDGRVWVTETPEEIIKLSRDLVARVS